jgi:hypothetical protein
MMIVAIIGRLVTPETGRFFRANCEYLPMRSWGGGLFRRLAINRSLWYGNSRRPLRRKRGFGPVAQPDRATVS